MPKVIECEECGFKMSGSNLCRQMKDHLHKLHGKACLWPCGKCNAEFDTRHLLSVHTCSENLVPLLRCGHAMYTVKAHGTGDFRECTFVGTQTQLSRHYKTLHLRQYARICPYCSVEFSIKSSLQRHLAGSCLKAHLRQKQGPLLCVATQAVVEQSNTKKTRAQVTVPKAQAEIIAAEDFEFSQITDHDMRELPQTMVQMLTKDGPPGSTTEVNEEEKLSLCGNISIDWASHKEHIFNKEPSEVKIAMTSKVNIERLVATAQERFDIASSFLFGVDRSMVPDLKAPGPDSNCKLVLKDIKGDGNCFYRAVSFCLTGSEGPHATLRSQLVGFLETMAEVLWAGQRINLKTTAEDGQWADQSHIAAMAAFLKIDIYTLNNEQWNCSPSSRNLRVRGPGVYLVNTGNSHYDVVLA